MKNFNRLLILSIIALLTFANCKDDDEPETNEHEKALAGETSKDWKITAIKGSTKNPAYSSISIDIYNNVVYLFNQPVPTGSYNLPEFPSCAKDNIITFKADKTYTVSEGATPCTSNYDFQLTQGTWAFTNNHETLTLTDKSGAVFNYEITKLTATEMDGENSGEFTYGGSNLDYTIKTSFVAL